MTLDPKNAISSPKWPEPGAPARAEKPSLGPVRILARLSDEQATFLARIRRTRAAGMLPSLEEIDILIGIVEELTK